MNTRRILAVDDDAVFGTMIQKGLEKFSYVTETFSSGEALIEHLQNHKKPPVDIILLDQLMRGMSGFDTFLKLKEMGITIPVIMITGNSSITLAIEFLKSGGGDFIEKPISSFEILDFRIRSLIEKVSNQKRLDQEEKEKELRTAFLANIAHDIRSPLANVGIGIDLAIRYISSENKERGISLLAKARGGIECVNALILNTLTLSSLESGCFDYVFEKNSLRDVISKAILNSEVCVTEKNISIDFPSSEKDIVMPFDQNSIYRVFLNLLGNAIKFSDSGERIAISIQESERLVTVAITDNGIGVPEKEVLTIFNRFARSKRTKRLKEGAGLGLAICHEIVLAHKGKIWAENNSTGKGTTFYVQLPKDEMEEAHSS